MAWTSKCHLYVILLQCLLVNFFMLSRHGASGHKNQYYHISDLCKNNNIPKYVRADGAVLTTEGGLNSSKCVITFLTDSTFDRFMLRFEWLALDCDDHLYIHDSAHSYGDYKEDLSCLSTKADVGTITTTKNSLTLNYVTNGSLSEKGFRFVITSYKYSSPSTCDGYSCTNSMCINKDLKCDGVNHCGDNSDETASCSDVEDVGLLPAAPEIIILSLKEGSLQLQWTVNENTTGNILDYTISYGIVTMEQGKGWLYKSCLTNITIPSCAPPYYTISVPSSGEFYKIQIKARTLTGFGKSSNLVFVQ